MIDFLELVNKVGAVVKKHSQTYAVLPNKEAKFVEHGYDSLDCVMAVIYVSEIYGVPQALSEKMFPATVQELEDMITRFKTQEPESLEAALGMVK